MNRERAIEFLNHHKISFDKVCVWHNDTIEYELKGKKSYILEETRMRMRKEG